MKIAFVGATVIDGTGSSPKADRTVVIEDTKIVEINQERDFGPDVQVYDVSGKTIMPGIIDVHMHFATWHTYLITSQSQFLHYRSCETVKAMKLALECGITSARDHGGLERGFCDAQTAGLIEGPRLQTSVTIIQPTNGLVDWMPPWGGAMTPMGLTFTTPGIPQPWADGVDGVRLKVREILRKGAHFIKFANTGWDPKWPQRTLFSKKEVEAIVDEAHRAGVPVTCHIHGSTQAMEDVVLAGVDSVEHGEPMTEELAEEMARRGTWWVPMATIMKIHGENDPIPELKAGNQEIFDVHFPQAIKWALDKGVRIAMGTDLGSHFMDCSGKELAYMVNAGMSPGKAIETCTKLAAEYMGISDVVGTIEAGKEADVLVLEGNPLEDITVLGRIESFLLVMQAGRPLTGPMIKQFPFQRPVLPWSQSQ